MLSVPGVLLEVEACLPPPSPDIDISPAVIPAGVSTTLSIQGLDVADGAWLVFLLAGDATCIGAAAAPGLASNRLSGGKVTVHFERAARYKLCASNVG